MDSIEQRLTTDVTLAQAVVDLSEVARFVGLDGGRSINLVRAGMVVDALGRYLIDAGAMLYPVVGRELLAEAALTSKERMVLGRWADDGLVEVTPMVNDRAVEIADFTGLPLIAVRDQRASAARFPWVLENPERVLRLMPRTGGAVLLPTAEAVPDSGAGEPKVVVGKASPPAKAREAPVAAPQKKGEATATDRTEERPTVPHPDGLKSFSPRGSQRPGRTRVVRRRFIRAEASGVGAALTAREWRCVEPECPAFGRYRRIGQPVPRMRAGVPACPRHGAALQDVGPRPTAFAISVVVDDLARRRFVVRADKPAVVGRAPDDPDQISVGDYLHEAAAAWIAKQHLRLEVRDDRLVVIDTSENGTLVWKRPGPDAPAETERIYHDSYQLDGWDSVELYTGVELVLGEHRLATIVGSEPASVLLDAPTVATRLVQ
jgi:hypothetical protein